MTRITPAAVFVAIVASALHSGAETVHARVADALTGMPIADAIVTLDRTSVRTDPQGLFAVDAAEETIVRVRAPGYLRNEVAAHRLREPNAEIRLTSFRPKALYLSVYGIGDGRLRTSALTLLDSTELNALVIDVKGDRGLIPYPSEIGLAKDVGAQHLITISDLPALVRDLRRRGIYTIARIVVFKDTLLATERPDLAIRRRDGSIFRDRERLAWTKPSSRAVWDYNIDVAVEAAAAGFDEIQFDYVRLPDATGVAFDFPWTEEHREAVIDGFLNAARERLTPFNVFLAADIFGYVCWNRDDTKIGQRIEHLAGILDYVSPMLYPSSFQYGIPGCSNPVEHPHEIVRSTLEEARARTQLPSVRFRPWLQAFRDYAFDKRPFTGGEVRQQIEAAEEFGADGWMLWNPHNTYSAADLKR